MGEIYLFLDVGSLQNAGAISVVVTSDRPGPATEDQLSEFYPQL